MRLLGARLVDQRVVIAGAGAAGIGIARLIRLAMIEDGATSDGRGRRRSPWSTHTGWSTTGGPTSTTTSARSPGRPRGSRPMASGRAGDAPPSLRDVVRVLRPTILLGATGMPGHVRRAADRRAGRRRRPPDRHAALEPDDARARRIPADILRWSDGRALVATGSPFAAVEHRRADRHEIGQANNVFVFPGLGLGAIVGRGAERCPTSCSSSRPGRWRRRSRTSGWPPARSTRRSIELRSVTRAIAWRRRPAAACATGSARLADDADLEAAVDARDVVARLRPVPRGRGPSRRNALRAVTPRRRAVGSTGRPASASRRAGRARGRAERPRRARAGTGRRR